VPHHGIGRGFKAGKEEIVGLLAALQRFTAADDEADNARLEARLREIELGLGSLRGASIRLLSANETGRVPQLHLRLDVSAAGFDAPELSRQLQAGDPPVHLSERFAAQGILIVDPQALAPDDDAALAAALRRAFGS
jgi:L-seryl-tRNA(Ser) seleniumtransferase